MILLNNVHKTILTITSLEVVFYVYTLRSASVLWPTKKLFTECGSPLRSGCSSVIELPFTVHWVIRSITLTGQLSQCSPTSVKKRPLYV